ncbi:MAG: hypothetical protein WBG50_08125, partial [Desulfomonilaceae bacterium]
AGHLPVQVPTLYHKARYCTRPFLPKTGKLTPATIIKVRNASLVTLLREFIVALTKVYFPRRWEA